MSPHDADLERRFGGLRRLHGDEGYARLRAMAAVVVGLGGVGSWTAEALARCGVARLVLIDMDHVAESNVNRQVQATSDTLGMAKGLALRERIASIHPGCSIECVDDFVTPENASMLLGAQAADVIIDACDEVRAKVAMASWATAHRLPLVCVGAAGGKRDATQVRVDDLARVTHDPLLASMRQRLRRASRQHLGAPQATVSVVHTDAKPVQRAQASDGDLGVNCVFSREAVSMPAQDEACDVDGSLNCHGYGSSVMVTATFGMVAAGEAVRLVLSQRRVAK